MNNTNNINELAAEHFKQKALYDAAHDKALDFLIETLTNGLSADDTRQAMIDASFSVREYIETANAISNIVKSLNDFTQEALRRFPGKHNKGIATILPVLAVAKMLEEVDKAKLAQKMGVK